MLLRLLDADTEERTFPKLAQALHLSASEVHAAVGRAAACGLLDRETRSVRRAALCEFLLHGLKYVFPAERLGVMRGLPTSYAGPPLVSRFAKSDLPPVWPYPEGTARGEGLAPLYKSAPKAAAGSPQLYEWLALIDAVRAGRARERNAASAELKKRLAA